MQLGILALLLALHTSISAQPTPLTAFEEHRVIDAVIHDPRLLDHCGGRIKLAGKTRLSGLHPWVRSDHDTTINIDNDPQNTFSISLELIESARARNTNPLSLKGFRPPAPSAWSGTRKANRGYWQLVAVSRPGLSADGTKAIVGVEEVTDVGPIGYTVYLERRNGEWIVILHGDMWEV